MRPRTRSSDSRLKVSSACVDLDSVSRALCILVSLAPIVLGGCIVAATQSPPNLDRAFATRMRATRAWTIESRAEPIGSLVRFEEPGSSDRAVYVVRNEWGQDLGLIDALGRAWRWRPHAEVPELVGTGTTSEGVGRILDGDASLVLREVGLAELQAPVPEPVPVEPAPTPET